MTTDDLLALKAKAEDKDARLTVSVHRNDLRHLIDEVLRLREETAALRSRASPSDYCHCPEFCLYHAREVFQKMKEQLSI